MLTDNLFAQNQLNKKSISRLMLLMRSFKLIQNVLSIYSSIHKMLRGPEASLNNQFVIFTNAQIKL